MSKVETNSVFFLSAKTIICACTVVLIFAGCAFANDTSAELATGGLVITRSADIEMQSESLFISMNEVRVQYRFYNHSDRDITTQIAFPMPEIAYGVDDFNFVIPTNNPENILGFTTVVNNHRVATLVERKAFLDGRDVTQTLRELDVPIAPQSDQKYDYISQEAWDQLIRLRLIQDEPKSDGHLNPRWTLKTTYYWQQTFPAHQELLIDHRYLPSVGSVVRRSASDLLNQPENLQIDQSTGTNRFCIDQSFLNAMVDPSPNQMWEQHIIEYVLTTGANWSGPIKNFRLIVDKGSADNLVSFCGRGARKINSTQFEIRGSNFVPTSNLSILILSPSRAEPSDVRSAPISPETSTNIATLNCDQLWYQRNSIFKTAGYCFHTPHAISVFGNVGCTYNDQRNVPLSEQNRQAINALQQIERMKRCP